MRKGKKLKINQFLSTINRTQCEQTEPVIDKSFSLFFKV